MKKILYLLLFISFASYGQSDKVKLNNKKDSIYKTVCFTLNDSLSDFKFDKIYDYSIFREYEYRIKGINYDTNALSPFIIVTKEEFKKSDSSNIKIFAEERIKTIFQEDKNAKVKKSDTTIGDNYEAYREEIEAKAYSIDMLLNIYYLKHNDKLISIRLYMQPTKDSPYYLQEFNKLANTIRFK